MDGHMKLSPYGIEIYAAIDAYSRYIIWIYVGVSGMTAVSVLRQYLDALAIQGVCPQILRSDHGRETELVADAHLQFRRTTTVDLPPEDAIAFGRSLENQRIECWWTNLTSRASPY